MKISTILSLCCIFLLMACHKEKPITFVVTEAPAADPNYHADGEIKKLYYNNPHGVNIVILGDGYVKDDLAIDGTFDKQVKQTLDYFFSVPPYSQNKQAFNVFVVYAESKSRGAAKGYNAANNNTVFNSYFDLTTDRLLIVGNTAKVNLYTSKITEASPHLVVVLVNDPTYGGSGGRLAVLSTHTLSKYIMVHEIGHTFAGLGDEYIDQAIANNYPLSQLPFMANIDDTADPTRVKWAHFINTPAYKSLVGAYEGAYYRYPGYYRPELHSCMESLSYANYNAPSREAIVKRINLILGVPYDFSAFLAADAFSIQPVRAASVDPAMALPKNDFIDMKERLQELEAEKRRLQ